MKKRNSGGLMSRRVQQTIMVVIGLMVVLTMVLSLLPQR